MRRPLALAIALLSTCLVAGECEFRATSNNAIRPPPDSGDPDTPPTGLTIDLRIGDPIEGPAPSTTSAIVQTALATSVLSNGDQTQLEGTAWSAPARPAEIFAPDDSSDRIASISSAVPEPSAVAVFGGGVGVAAWWIRRRARRSRRGRR